MKKHLSAGRLMGRVRHLLGAIMLGLALSTPSFANSASEPTESELRSFAANRLIDAVLLYDKHFRVRSTGQYRDSLMIDSKRHDPMSSTASTGMGLISLALGDALGIIPDATEKAEITLAHLLGKGTAEGFETDRSKNGWFRHWFNSYTGVAAEWNQDKFSTIDSAILAAGAAILESYLVEKARREEKPLPRAAALARELIMSVEWSTAIRDPKRGSIHLVFFGTDERPTEKVATVPFDEYALLPCIAARHERLRGKRGPAREAWKRRFESAEDLPMKTYGAFTLLGKPRGKIPSHFTHQFAFYLCGAYASDPVFLSEMSELKRADQQWFEKENGSDDLWGLGAGSELVFGANKKLKGQRYAVSKLEDNEQGTASPAIMAGFMPVDEAEGRLDILKDLHALWTDGRCRYEFEGLGFLWRCAPGAPRVKVNRLEGVDFSTWMFGLAVAHPKIGFEFFQRHAF